MSVYLNVTIDQLRDSFSEHLLNTYNGESLHLLHIQPSVPVLDSASCVQIVHGSPFLSSTRILLKWPGKA